MKTATLAGVATLFSLAAWPADIQPMDVKPGLWATVHTFGPRPVMQHVSKVCITAESLNQPLSQALGLTGKGCTLAVVSSSRARQQIHVECDSGDKSSGDITIERADPEHITGAMLAKTIVGGRSTDRKVTIADTWVQTDCGDGEPAVRPDAAAPAAAPQPAARDIAPPDCDFDRLGLQVTSVRAVPSIRSQNTVYSPKPGRQLVVVHLKGKENVPASFTQASNWSDIQAVYGVPAAQSGGLEFAIEPALGFVVMELMGGGQVWAFSKAAQSDGMSLLVSAINGHQITSSDGSLVRVPNGEITVAFSLPAGVKTITLRFPAAAKDAAGTVVHELK